VEQHFATAKPKEGKVAQTNQGGCAMEADPEDEVLVRVDLDKQTVAHYERRAETAS
jgi:hypothetical protein